MFESLLRINNVSWSGETFQPACEIGRDDVTDGESIRLRGRFARASVRPAGGVTLARDRLGLNKLFVAIHESNRVLVANYVIDLVRRRVPFETIYSVPAGHLVQLDPARDVVTSSSYWEADAGVTPATGDMESIARDIRAELELWFRRLARQFGHRRICICLSGGIDSGIMAALAKEYFSDITAYTYTFTASPMTISEDAIYAEWLAKQLRIPFRLVTASSEDVLAALENALCYGQDWRDFNVHCAVVNDIIASAIRRDAQAIGAGELPIVLTGDLANEFLADYTPVSFNGRNYYRLPSVTMPELRSALIRGLDSGDREVGIFNHHGLDVIQPYSFVVDHYLRLPGSCIGAKHSKQALAKVMAGDLLPAFVLERVKVRAQMGSSGETPGILPVFVQTGYDSSGLRNAFCRLFEIERPAFLARFVRAGRYRALHRFSKQRSLINGYVAA